MSYPSDTSTQLNNALTISDSYSSSSAPNINFNSTSGIYNPSANVIKIFTNNTDALTINGSQQLSGNGTGLTNLNYNAILNAPTLFSGSYNDLTNKPSLFSGSYNDLTNKPSLFSGIYTDLSSKPDLTVYATNTNLNNLSNTVSGHTTSINDLSTAVNYKENALTFIAPLTRNINTISLDLSSYLTSATASTTYATITNLNTKENTLTFSAPLTRTTNTISLDLSGYATTSSLSSYLTSATASTTYATITNLNTKENTLTFSAPLTRTSNTISLDLSGYATTSSLSNYITTTNANALNSRFFNNNGNNFITYTDFNSPTQFGYNFIMGTTNGPGVNSAAQYYAWDIGLGSNYGFGSYRAQFALPRNVASPYLCVRYQENTAFGSWQKLSAAYADSAGSIAYANVTGKPDLTVYATTSSLSSYLTTATASTTYATITNLNTKENALTFSAPLTRTTNTISLDLSSYLTSATASTTYATITNLNTKENTLTFSAPLTRTTNTISLDLSGYATTSSLSSYLTSATASTTYATITNLNTKENALTFSAPLTRTTNTISLDLSSYLTSATASTTYATITNLNTKENALTFSAPLTRTSNTISLDLSSYITTTNANNLNYRFFNNNGNNHGNLTDFNSSSQFGYNFIQGSTNGPGVNGAGQYYSWDIGLGANYGFGTYRAQFALPRNVGNPYLCVRYQENGGYTGWNRISAGYADTAANASGTNFAVTNGSGNGCVKLNSGGAGDTCGYIEFYNAYGTRRGYIGFNRSGYLSMAVESTCSGYWMGGNFICDGTVTGLVFAINNTGTDYLGVYYNFPNTSTGISCTYYAMLGSFTGFHRCFTNDELYNDESDETIKDFKFKYAGRVVIASGSIATDDSNDDNKSWTIHYDKEGITLEDALPIVQLSRTRKDKRVFGVFGLPKRNNSRIQRMIINSVGEGGIWVVDTNGNIENGDYLQSSNELGYGEKQDDDILHNYTIGKATIDCSFELNSDKYTTIVLDNGVKASFIACSYHCG